MAQNESRFGMLACHFKLAHFDRNHWHNKAEIGDTNRIVLSIDGLGHNSLKITAVYSDSFGSDAIDEANSVIIYDYS